MSDHDVIVLGSGPNELVTACFLAKAGRRVLVLEPRDTAGAAAALREIAPHAKGFRLDVAEAMSGFVSPKVVADLGLSAFGFEASWPPACVVTPRLGDSALVLWRDMAKTRASIEKHSAADAGKWEPFCTRMTRLAGFLETLYTQEAPRLMSEQAGDLVSLLTTGLRLRRLGKVDMIELLRTLPMSVQDLLDDWFESDVLKGTIGAGGITNILQGPRSAGTCFVMLHHLVGRPPGAFRSRMVVKSERGHLMTALGVAAKKLGVEIRTNAPAKVIVKNGRAMGVVLRSGEELHAQAVVSGADAKTTFRDLVDPIELSPEVNRAVGNVKLRGARAFVLFALGELPKLSGVPAEALGGTISISPSLDYLERAYDDAKHGGVSSSPYLEATIPSLADPSLAPPGKHVMSVAMQYAPYHRKDRAWDATAKDELADRVATILEQLAPGFTSSIVARAVHSPLDLEERFGLREGHLYGGELGLDQILFMRPLPGFAHYRTPIERLFMCGDACHPGGALPGLAGANAAREILKDAPK
jgi:phytoene dehydrogenase-like protein